MYFAAVNVKPLVEYNVTVWPHVTETDALRHITNKEGHPTTNGQLTNCTQGTFHRDGSVQYGGGQSQANTSTLCLGSLMLVTLHAPAICYKGPAHNRHHFWLSCCDLFILQWQIQRVMHFGTCQLDTQHPLHFTVITSSDNQQSASPTRCGFTVAPQLTWSK